MESESAVKTILVIEDDKLLLKILTKELAAGGYIILSAVSGEEGLQLALTEHPHLILLDILLIEMDGIAFLSELREDSWGARVPVIVLTNLSDAVKINQALDKGVRESDYLKKSEWDLKGVLKKVNERLTEEESASP